MDSKRKANGHVVGAEGQDDRAAKRQKPDVDLSQGETAETTSQYGLPFIDQVKRTQDKSKRPVATAFLTLPNRRQFPDYYEKTKMPIALDTIERKLERREFPTLTALESFFKRMVQNAKDYNEPTSEIAADAERLRKALSNYMSKTNPAYKTPGYVAVPTPIPAELLNAVNEQDEESDEDAEGESDEESPAPMPNKRAPGRPKKNASAADGNDKRSSLTPALTDAQYSQDAFSSLTFQQAQEKMIGEMLKHTLDDNESLTYEPFFNLPNRALKDYYAVIPNPMSIKQIQKKVRGIVGRGEPTGVSLYKTWKAFEEDFELIWNNARHYNEDKSDIFLLATNLETFFNKRIKKAKQAVPEPAQHKLKLKVSAPAVEAPRILLRVGAKASPADSPAGTPRLNGIDSPVNGTAPRRNPFGGVQTSSATLPSLGQLDRTRSMSGSVASPTPSTSAIVKNEEAAKPSPSILNPAMNFSQGGQNGRPSSSHQNGSFMLPPIGNQTVSGYGAQYSSSGQYGQHPTPVPAVDTKWRQPGKDASDAMITNLSINTHTGLNITRHFQMDLPPSATLAHQSITINLPATHYYLQIQATLAAPLLERHYKIFATSGIHRLNNVPRSSGSLLDSQNPNFDVRLSPGVNRIEIELIAALPKGAPKGANGQDVEMEKITIFANLMRN